MKRLLIFLWLPMAGLSLCRAATVSTAEAVARALAGNADLAAARLVVAEARGRLDQAGRMPNPQAETLFRPHVNGRERSGEFGITQRFPLTARLRLAKSVSKFELAAAEAEVADVERRLAGDVREAATRMLALNARTRLRLDQRTNSLHLVEAAKKAMSVGEGAEIDALQYELEAGQISARITALEAQSNVLNARLRLLLGIRDDEPVVLSGGLAEPVATTPDAAQPAGKRADQRLAEARAGAAMEEARLARASKWEDAGVGVFSEIDRNEDAPNGIQTDKRIGVRLSLPLPLWNRNRGRIASADAAAERAEREAKALELRVRAERMSAAAEMRGAFNTLRRVSDDLLPQARLIESRITSARSQGQASITDLLRARERRLDLEAAQLDALEDYHLAAARLITAGGSAHETSAP